MSNKSHLLLIAGMFLAGILGGMISNRLSPTAAQASAETTVVAARVFHLVDEQGNQRASLGFDEDNNPTLLFRDKAGNNRAFFAQTSIGPAIQFMDASGKSRLNLSLDKKGSPSIYLAEGPQKVQTIITVNSEGNPLIALADHNGRPRLLAGLAKEGAPNIILKNGAEAPLMSLMVHQGFGPGLFLNDESGRPRLAYTAAGQVDPNSGGLPKAR